MISQIQGSKDVRMAKYVRGLKMEDKTLQAEAIIIYQGVSCTMTQCERLGHIQ